MFLFLNRNKDKKLETTSAKEGMKTEARRLVKPKRYAHVNTASIQLVYNIQCTMHLLFAGLLTESSSTIAAAAEWCLTGNIVCRVVVCSATQGEVMEKTRAHSSSDGEPRTRRIATSVTTTTAAPKGQKSDVSEKQRTLSSSGVAETKRTRAKGQGNKPLVVFIAPHFEALSVQKQPTFVYLIS